MRRWLMVVIVMAALGIGSGHVCAQERLAPAGQEEYVPVSELDDVEQLPAAPLVITAYAVIWAGAFLYLLSIWRRLGTVDRELDTLRRRLRDSAPPESRQV